MAPKRRRRSVLSILLVSIDWKLSHIFPLSFWLNKETRGKVLRSIARSSGSTKLHHPLYQPSNRVSRTEVCNPAIFKKKKRV
ncbi:hypothetical protein CLU79DRAFT_749839 [Phycomyces nitens]|nr:hypothetical protein CLU79DRAFT_749839 [Phycomyces nitens]